MLVDFEKIVYFKIYYCDYVYVISIWYGRIGIFWDDYVDLICIVVVI